MDKVLIELYDNDALENVISIQLQHYDILVFMCFKNSDPDQKKRSLIKETIRSRTGTEVYFKEAEEKSIESAAAAFAAIKKEYPDHLFSVDITGGDEIFIAALGFFMADDKDNVFSVHKSDVAKGELTPAIGSGPISADGTAPLPRFSFSEVIRLYGRSFLGSWPDEFTHIAEERRYEILRVWNAVKDIASEWNKFCSIPYANDNMTDEKGFISRRFTKESDLSTSMTVMERLSKRGIIKTYSIGENYLKYMLRPSAKTSELYSSAGTALEMFTALAASETHKFRECYAKVTLDCDGIKLENGEDPYNELDVTLMYGFIPVFISCKNTEVTNFNMYEINVLASHFGGKYAIPVLVSTKPALQPMKERAKEMHTILIDDVQSMNLKQFKSAIEKSICRI